MKKKQKRAVIAIDLGGTWIKAARIDQEGTILGTARRETEAGAGVPMILNKIEKVVRQLTGRGRGGTAAALGIGIPGYIKSKNGLVVQSPNLPALDGVFLGAELRRRFPFPCRLENDANCAALGEGWLGSGRTQRDFLFVTLGTGVGGGLVLNRKLWSGPGGRAGEIGHIAVEMPGVLCGCGASGCLETVSGQLGISRLVREQPDSAWQERHFQSVPMADYPRVLGQLARAGDLRALSIMERVGQSLGAALAAVINVLDLRCFIFGGGVGNLFPLLERAVREEIRNRVFGFPMDELALLPAALGEKAGMLGAARLALEL